MNRLRAASPVWHAAATAAFLFLIVVGAKWAVFFRYGSPMPDWDQWDAEAVALLIPWFEGRDFLQQLFLPHNEHRVVVTKLQTLALTLANGQWDSRLQAVFNAILHSTVAVAFWLLLRRWIAARWHAAVFLLIVALFALPFAWQNILGGFHSQQYWLVALSVWAIVVLPFCRAWSAAWWLAAVAAVAALLTMGSGLLAPAVVCVVAGFRLLRRQASWRELRPTLIVAAALVAIGLLTRAEHPGHAGLKAQSVRDFVVSTLHSMEWPLRDRPWSGPVMWLPWALLLWRVSTRSTGAGDQRGPQTIAALGGWAMLQILATSYARGVGADYPASRYMDTLALGALANGAALAWLAGELRPSLMTRLATGLLAAAWVALVALGLHRETDNTFRYHLPGARKYYNNAENHLRGYLTSGDPAHLKFPDIPYPNADALMERLDNPHLRALMPAVLRAPLVIKPAALRSARPVASSAAREPGAPDAAFVENLAASLRSEENTNRGLSPGIVPLDFVKTWGSFGPAGAAATGEWRSAPLSSPLGGWLKFETAGHLGEPGLALELRDAASDALLATVRPSKVPGDAWRAAYVRAPTGRFVIVARDSSESRWMAFGAPVELGTLSYWAWRFAKHGLFILCVGIAGSVIMALVALSRKGHQSGTGAKSASATSATPNDLRRGA